MMPTALIVDDEEDVRELVKFNLTRDGFETLEAANGLDGLEKARTKSPDVIILDLMLPEMDGLTVYRNLQKDTRTREIPVLMLTARDKLDDRLEGLSLGADDYIPKPFSPKELVLRVKNVVRRSSLQGDPSAIVVGPFRLDRNTLKFYLNEQPIDLTATEFKLLMILIEHVGEDQPRGELLQKIWGYDERIQTRTLDTHVKRLREKLEGYGDCIETVRGIGYRFRRPS